ncbi:hypothetical protein [Streptomyces radicis]|uniref:Uncharacterized protein n=1 Tax=Streptomyces radicis TaxID=1750517 RepID=A0A3A9WAG7_9ACTN|nr:hypothetical protein [Streptomyces radicis]RKN09632.1 hypothetical protein D7319_11245 [Streptomyces radicis]
MSLTATADAQPTGSLSALLRALPDAGIRRPLWEFAPGDRKAVIHERKRRFGWDDGEGHDDG